MSRFLRLRNDTIELSREKKEFLSEFDLLDPREKKKIISIIDENEIRKEAPYKIQK